VIDYRSFVFSYYQSAGVSSVSSRGSGLLYRAQSAKSVTFNFTLYVQTLSLEEVQYFSESGGTMQVNWFNSCLDALQIFHFKSVLNFFPSFCALAYRQVF
jgi:hypothetical protein